jgi:hypothetical protein
VWDASGPSLKELLALENAKNQLAQDVESVAHAPKPADSFANVEAVAANDLGAVWKSLLDMMAAHGPGMHSLLSQGTFSEVRDGQAVITYSKKNETFTKLLDRNGKKDLVRDGLSKILGQAVGVKFVVDEAMGEADLKNATPAARSENAGVSRETAKESGAALRSQNSQRSAPASQEMPVAVPAVRITPELVEQVRADPLVALVMDKFNATLVKIE